MSDLSEDIYSEDEYMDEEEGSEEEIDEDGEDDGREEDLEPMNFQEPLTKQHSFEVISEDQMLKESRVLIEGVMEFLGIPNRAVAACLLRSFK